MRLSATVLNPGRAEGAVLALDEPLSFSGGLDPASGLIIDRHHPQRGERMTGRILRMSSTRGSSGTPSVLGESLRLGTGPAGIVLAKPDINVVAAAFVVREFYGLEIPVVHVNAEDYVRLGRAETLSIEPAGQIVVEEFLDSGR